MTVMHNDCCLGGGEFRRSKTAKILDNTDTEREMWFFCISSKMESDSRIRMSFFFGNSSEGHSAQALCVGSALDLAFDVVALAEESEPVVEHLLVFVREVRPIGTALLRLERRLYEGARSVLASEDFEAIVLVGRPG